MQLKHYHITIETDIEKKTFSIKRYNCKDALIDILMQETFYGEEIIGISIKEKI